MPTLEPDNVDYTGVLLRAASVAPASEASDLAHDSGDRGVDRLRSWNEELRQRLQTQRWVLPSVMT